MNWRRAIHQPVQFVACRAGAATIEVWHETAVEILYTYEFRIRPADGEQQYPDLVVGSPTVDDSSPAVGHGTERWGGSLTRHDPALLPLDGLDDHDG